MASGSSGRVNPVSKGFDFGSDDILCSYEDYGNHQDSSNGSHSDPVVPASSIKKDYHKSRKGRPSVFPAASYGQPEDSFDQGVIPSMCPATSYGQPEYSFNQDVIAAVEKSMKKHTDNIMRFLEGISSRLSQLELYCYNLDKSIGEMRSDLERDHGEAESKLKSLEKHIQEVHMSVQILRDKQELAKAQKELVKLQRAQKESSSSSHPQSNEEKTSSPAFDPKLTDSTSEMPNQRLALALPHRVAPQQQPPPVPPLSQAPSAAQHQSYFFPPRLPTPASQTQHPQSQYLSSDPQYRASQMQDMSRVAPQTAQTQVNQMPPGQQFPQYQQQWPQQLSQQVQPPQKPSMQSQIRPASTAVYPPYTPAGQPTNPPTSETLPNTMPIPVSHSAIPQPLSSRADTMPYGYGAGRTVQQQLAPQQITSNFGAQPGDAYAPAGPHPSFPPVSAYMMYDGEAGRTNHPPQQPHFPQGGYPPTNLSLQSAAPTAGSNVLPPLNPSHSHFIRNNPYNELIEKLVSMGFRGDHVVSVIQKMEESSQPVDFNAVLDRLNAHSSVVPQRGWSG